LVWRREGAIRELPIVAGNIVQDNNLLACSRSHQRAVFDMLAGQKAVVFSGGLDTRYFLEWTRRQLEQIAFSELWFACDRATDLDRLKRVRDLCSGISIEKLRCYVLVGYGKETLAQAADRLQAILDLGFLPFAQLYQSPSGKRRGDWGWLQLARKWSRPAAYRSNRSADAETIA
jgi:hypothetical protein